MKTRGRHRQAKREHKASIRQANRDVAAANQYQSYRIGWLAGANVSAMDPKFTTHENPELRAAYELGYRDGGIARRAALDRASKRYGYVPQVLRLQG